MASMVTLHGLFFKAPASVFVTAMTVMSMVVLTVFGVNEVRGKHLQYSKMAAATNSGAKLRSKSGMTILYLPAFLFAAASFFVFPVVDSRFFLIRCAVSIHFLKRLLETWCVHKYSGSMTMEAVVIISSSYFSFTLTIIYAQYLSLALPPPSIDLMHVGLLLFIVGTCRAMLTFAAELLTKHENPIESFNHYSSTDLMKATNNYHDSMILGQGGQGTVYKGVLPNKKIVAIKKSNVIDKTQMEQFINEVIVLSQINHRNVVKLLGCCLETEVPMLVYEFITNGTLLSHIQEPNNATKMPWQTRLRIALETAKALSYLHSEASVPIIHRDVKSTNILLDESYTAKVSDFGTSRFAPMDRTSLTTLVQGTFGYLDPEYFFSSQVTEKSDVYSFGVVLAELLTGEKAVSFDRKEEERSLALYFVSAIKEDKLLGIIEGSLKREENIWQLKQVAMVAASCLRVKGEDRPAMNEVATELEALMKMNIHPWVEIELNEGESHVLLGGEVERSDLPVGR